MWKPFFDFLWFISYFIPFRGVRTWFRLNKCYDYKNKLRAIRAATPELDWGKMRLAKGGGSLAFIIDDTVFKVRKFHKHDNSAEKFEREKRITDAVAPVLPVAVPKIELIQAGPYLFYKTHFIPGRVLVDLPLKRIIANNDKIGKQIGQIIYSLFNADLKTLRDMMPKDAKKRGLGMVHGDMCSNIIVNPNTMDVVGIIDWEYAYFNSLWYEFYGIYRVRRKMRQTDIAPIAMWEYYRLRDEKSKKTK